MLWIKFWFKWELWPLLSHRCNMLTLFYLWVLQNSQTIMDPLTCWANGVSRMLYVDGRTCILFRSLLTHRLQPSIKLPLQNTKSKTKVLTISIWWQWVIKPKFGTLLGTGLCATAHVLCPSSWLLWWPCLQIGVIIRCLGRIAMRSN